MNKWKIMKDVEKVPVRNNKKLKIKTKWNTRKFLTITLDVHEEREFLNKAVHVGGRNKVNKNLLIELPFS